MNNVQKYYLPEPTPWPIFGCSALLMMAVYAKEISAEGIFEKINVA